MDKTIVLREYLAILFQKVAFWPVLVILKLYHKEDKILKPNAGAIRNLYIYHIGLIKPNLKSKSLSEQKSTSKSPDMTHVPPIIMTLS